MIELMSLLPLALLGLTGLALITMGDHGNDEPEHLAEQPITAPEQDPDAARPSGEGTDGDDVIYLPNDEVTLSGGAGNDLIFAGNAGAEVDGGAGDDTFVGGDGRNEVVDTSGSNLIFGGDATDVFTIGGDSTVQGGGDTDYFRLDIDLDAQGPAVITDFVGGEDVLTQIYLETAQPGVLGSLTGEVWENGEGIDLIFAGKVVASIKGGQDIDLRTIDLSTIDMHTSVTADSVTFGDGDDTILPMGADQEIHAGGGNDVFWGRVNMGDTGADRLFGDDGNDTIGAYGESDDPYTVYGEGEATLTTPPLIDGGNGDDALISYNGTVRMTGGAGADKFGIDSVDEGPSIITDFQDGQDNIYIEATTLQPHNVLTIQRWDDGAGADVLLDGRVVAHVTGGQNLRVEDIYSYIDEGDDLFFLDRRV